MGETTNNKASGGSGEGTITYTIAPATGVAMINSTNGELTIQGAGKATITARKAADANYNTRTNTYKLTVNKADRPALTFSSTSITVNYKENLQITNTATGGGDTGEIRYSIDQDRVSIIAAIEENSGQLTIQGVGTATIKASIAEDANYKEVFTTYLLTVNQGEQPALGFTQSSITITYGEVETVTNAATGGSTDSSLIIYTIDKIGGDAPATIDRSTGILTIIRAGTATITARRDGGANYHPVFATYLLTVKKAQQDPLTFAQTAITLDFVVGDTTSNKASGGSSEGTITYTIDSTTGVATIDSVNGKLIIQGAGTATITATKAGDAKYESVFATYLLIVNKGEQSPLTFARPSLTLERVPGLERSNIIISGGLGEGTITYSIDNEDVAMVNAMTGKVTVTSESHNRHSDN